MSSFNTIRLPDGTNLSISEWLHWPLYSTVEIGAGDGINVDAFSYARGQTVAKTSSITQRTANDMDTNVLRRKKMGQDEALVVMSITYEIFGLADLNSEGSPSIPESPAPLYNPADLARLQRDCVVDLVVGANIKKPQVGVPFSYVPQSVGTTSFVSGDLASAAYATGGYPSPLNQRQLMLPVYIGGHGQNAMPGNSMHFKLRFTAPGGAISDMNQNARIRFWLDGLKKRPG